MTTNSTVKQALQLCIERTRRSTSPREEALYGAIARQLRYVMAVMSGAEANRRWIHALTFGLYAAHPLIAPDLPFAEALAAAGSVASRVAGESPPFWSPNDDAAWSQEVPGFVNLLLNEFCIDITRVRSSPATPANVEPVLRAFVAGPLTREALVGWHRPNRRELARRLNIHLSMDLVDDHLVQGAATRAVRGWLEALAKRHDLRRARVREHLMAGTLSFVIRGEDCVYRTPPEVNADVLPTDPAELLGEAIDPLVQELGANRVRHAIEQAMLDACTDAIGVHCAVECYWAQMCREAHSTPPFTLDREQLPQLLLSACQHFRAALEQLPWDAGTPQRSKWDWALAIWSQLAEQHGLRVDLEQFAAEAPGRTHE